MQNIWIINKHQRYYILTPKFFLCSLVLYSFFPSLSPSLNISPCSVSGTLYQQFVFFLLSPLIIIIVSFYCGILLIGPFGPSLPSRPCLCWSPAASHWTFAAEGAKRKREVRERLKMEEKHWDEGSGKDEQRDLIIKSYYWNAMYISCRRETKQLSIL